MNKKQISINMIINFLSFMIGLGIAFFLSPYIIRVLGVEAYSFFPMANNIIGYLSIITAAINSMANRFISIAYHKGEIEKANAYFNTVLLTDIVLSIVLFSIGIILIIFLNKLINIPADLVLDVKILFVLVFLASMIVLALSVFSASAFVANRVDIKAYISVFKVIIRAGILLLLFAFLTPNIVYIGLAALIMFLFEALSYIKVCRKITPELNVNFKFFQAGYIKVLLKPGIWNSLGRINIILLTGLDLVIANIFLGVSDSGILALSKTVPTYVYNLLNIVALSFNPSLTSGYAKDESSLVKNLYSSFIPLTILGSAVIGGVIAIGDIFYQLWIPSEKSNELYILSILTLIPYIVNYGLMTLNYVFVIKNRLKLIAIIRLGVAVLTFITVIILIKTTNLGIYAIAGVSSVFLSVLYLTFTIPYVSRCLNVKWYTFYPQFFKSMLCLGIVIAIGFAVRNIIEVNSWISFALAAMAIVLVSLIINLFVITKKSERILLYKKAKSTLKKVF